jgi:hypothetical protein
VARPVLTALFDGRCETRRGDDPRHTRDRGRCARCEGPGGRASLSWFESFQNWQSEFVSIIVLSVFLRERGSAQSKPVAAPHDATA